MKRIIPQNTICEVAEELKVHEKRVEGTVAAGYPAEADNYTEDRIDMNKYILGLKDSDKKLDSEGNVVYYNRNKEHIKCVWATNKNMTGEGIDYTDLIVFDTTKNPGPQSVILYWLDDEFVLKRSRKHKDYLELKSLNKDIPTIKYDGDLKKIGVVTHVIKKMSAHNNQIAGYPNDAERYIATGIDFNEYVIGKDNLWETFFYLWSGGDSMKGDGISKGDLLAVDKYRNANHDSIIVFYIDRQYTLKRIERYKDHVRLVSSNPEMNPIVVKQGEYVKKWGVLVNVIKKF